MKKGHENLIIAISKSLGLSEPLIFLITSGGVGIQTPYNYLGSAIELSHKFLDLKILFYKTLCSLYIQVEKPSFPEGGRI